MDLIRDAGEAGVRELTKIFCDTLKGEISEDCRGCITIHFYKGNGGNCSAESNEE